MKRRILKKLKKDGFTVIQHGNICFQRSIITPLELRWSNEAVYIFYGDDIGFDNCVIVCQTVPNFPYREVEYYSFPVELLRHPNKAVKSIHECIDCIMDDQYGEI